MFFIPIFIALGLGIFLLIADGLCSLAVNKRKKQLETYGHKDVVLGSGAVRYMDCGEGEVILSVHGIAGGYDEAFDRVVHLVPEYRVIAPSRFGYPGSDIPADPSPKEQARVFKELLDSLKVDRVFVLAASVGGVVAIRFALDYPERVKGLILYSSIAPLKDRSMPCPKYAGFPAALCNNFGMWMASLFFEPVLSIKRESIYTMLPIEGRKGGIINDAAVVTADMGRNYDEYPIEDLQAPVLFFQAKDDKFAKCELMEQAVPRFPFYDFIEFKGGGHSLHGNDSEIAAEEKGFFKAVKG